MTPKVKSGLWIVFGLTVLIAAILAAYPYVSKDVQRYTPPKTYFSFDRMIEICRGVSAEARRAAGYEVGERSYQECMEKRLRGE